MRFTKYTKPVMTDAAGVARWIENERHIKTLTMKFLMLSTNMNRMLSKADLEEFLHRMAISFDCYEPVESWRKTGVFFTVTHKGLTYDFDAQDLEIYFGFEVINQLINFEPREVYYENADKYLSMTFAVDYIKQVFNLDQNNADIDFQEKHKVGAVTAGMKSKATLFAEEIMLTMPADTWEKHAEARQAKIEEIRQRKASIALLPVFDIKKISTAVIKKCIAYVFPEEQLDYYLQDEDEFKKFVVPIVYLLWLEANGHLHINKDGWHYASEGYDFNYEDFELFDDKGINNLLDYFDLEDLRPLLKI